MNKKTKIILSCIIGVLLLGGIGLAVDYALNDSEDTLTGTLSEGGGEYDWVKHSVWIGQERKDTNRYRTNCKGDYIYDIYYIYDSTNRWHRIKYYQNFWISDDLEACFVLANTTDSETITTDIEVSHTAAGEDECIALDEDGYLKNWYVKEIWVRTVD